MLQKVANYKRFRELVNEWVDLEVERARAERAREKHAVEINPNQLPSDPAALRQMMMGLLGEAEERERQMQHWVEQLPRARYGPRRELVDENQLFLFAAGILAQ